MEHEPNYVSLQARLGAGHAQRRLSLQAQCAARIYGGGLLRFHIENMMWLHASAGFVLRAAGLWPRAHGNALRPEVRHHAARIRDLPPALDGLRLLHLSDLHCDHDAAFIPALIKRLEGLDYDLCVITGDFRMKTFGPYEPALSDLQPLADVLKKPAFAVLGNHDYLEMVTGLEAMGIRVLLNEAVPVERGGTQLWIAGVDDAHDYETADVARAMRAIPSDKVAILLAHSPDVYREAARKGVALMLCGHTHGGQLCLPGGVMLLTNSRCGRRFCKGTWRHDRLIGYTSSGTGSSGLAARLNCPTEIVVHRLERGD